MMKNCMLYRQDQEQAYPFSLFLLSIVVKILANQIRQEKKWKVCGLGKKKQNWLCLHMMYFIRESQRVNKKTHGTKKW